MILTYSYERFPNLIKAGVKIHTIREDKHNRWKPGMKIHHWMHSPRHPWKHPYCFLINQCVSVQSVTLWMVQPDTPLTIVIGGFAISEDELKELVHNDGFPGASGYEQFKKWFAAKQNFPMVLKSWKIIHWTDKRY